VRSRSEANVVADIKKTLFISSPEREEIALWLLWERKKSFCEQEQS
jgi:hypothetical protein